jgi:hypothetical protein
MDFRLWFNFDLQKYKGLQINLHPCLLRLTDAFFSREFLLNNLSMFKAQNQAISFLFVSNNSTTRFHPLLLSAQVQPNQMNMKKSTSVCVCGAQFHILPIGADLGQVQGWSLQITPGSPPLSAPRAHRANTHSVFFCYHGPRASGRTSVRFSSHIEIGKIFAAFSPRAPRNEGGFTAADAAR